MKEQETSDLLKQLIAVKEAEQQVDYLLLKEHFHQTCENLKPVNIIKNIFSKIIVAPELKTNIFNSAIGIATGFVAKKVFTGKLHSPLTTVAGIILEMVIAGQVTKNADQIKRMGQIILSKVINKFRNSEKTL